MAKNSGVLLPRHDRLLADLGENLRLARLRRRLSAAQVAERAGISRSTLHLMEDARLAPSRKRAPKKQNSKTEEP